MEAGVKDLRQRHIKIGLGMGGIWDFQGGGISSAVPKLFISLPRKFEKYVALLTIVLLSYNFSPSLPLVLHFSPLFSSFFWGGDIQH